MRKNIFFAFSFVCGLYCMAGCSKENQVVEKKFASFQFNAYTVDNYRFRVSLGNEMVTDSLITPRGNVAKEIFFNDYRQRIKVYNTSDETLLIDTPYTVRVGASVLNSFTIYQTEANTPPFYLAPLPNEPKPGRDTAKLSVICSGIPTDSVKVVVVVGRDTVDNVRLKKDNFSRYLKIPVKERSRIMLFPIPGNSSGLLGSKIFEANELPAELLISQLLYDGSSLLLHQKLY